MQIDIQHIAKLSRLSIEKEKVEKFQRDGKYCGHVRKAAPDGWRLYSVDPSNPMQLRQDEIRPSLKRDQLLQNAPQTQAGCVVVPKVVE